MKWARCTTVGAFSGVSKLLGGVSAVI